MKLSAYLEAQGLTHAEFAKLIGVKKPDTVGRYARGERRPRRHLIGKIAEVTEGEVTANDFFGIAA